MSLTNDANRAGSTYLNSGHIYNIISRRIIDRNWFPVCFRAGHHVERPDANFFLEQWVPFDFSNDAGLVVRANKLKLDLRLAKLKSWIPIILIMTTIRYEVLVEDIFVNVCQSMKETHNNG